MSGKECTRQQASGGLYARRAWASGGLYARRAWASGGLYARRAPPAGMNPAARPLNPAGYPDDTRQKARGAYRRGRSLFTRLRLNRSIPGLGGAREDGAVHQHGLGRRGRIEHRRERQTHRPAVGRQHRLRRHVGAVGHERLHPVLGHRPFVCVRLRSPRRRTSRPACRWPPPRTTLGLGHLRIGQQLAACSAPGRRCPGRLSRRHRAAHPEEARRPSRSACHCRASRQPGPRGFDCKRTVTSSSVS